MTTDSKTIAVDAAPFIFPTRVYWEDTDAGGVVYHAQYVAFLERTRTEWLRARLDDLLQVSARIHQCKRASVVFAQTIERGGEVLLTAEVKVAALSASGFRPVALPETLYEEFRRLETSGPPL